MLEIVRGICEAWARGDFTAGPVHFDPGIRFESFMPDSTERQVFEGMDEIMRMAEFLRAWRGYRLVGERFEALDERTVLVTGYQDAARRFSGVDVRDTAFSVWTFRDDRVVRLVFERDREAALRSVG